MSPGSLKTLYILATFTACSSFNTFRDISSTYDRLYFQKFAAEDIHASLARTLNSKFAKNVIVFVGDGLDPSTTTATRTHRAIDSGYLSFEKFPHVANIKTFSHNKLVSNVASAATAMFSGTKGFTGTVGLDSSVQRDDCVGSLNLESHLDNVFTWAQEAEKATGFVTNGRITRGAVTALYAHVADVDWECEENVPRRHKRCTDVATQLVTEEPGKYIKVVMGGGKQCLKSDSVGTPENPIDQHVCYSRDGRDLIRDWKLDKQRRKFNCSVVTNNFELEKLDLGVDYVLGVFANGNLKYDYERNKGAYGTPSLSKMAEKAIPILAAEENGFLLVVESFLIDDAHHKGRAKLAISEALAFDQAVENTLKLVNDLQIQDETLILVVGTHSHGMVIAGYPSRTSDVLGIAQMSPVDRTSYTTLLYLTGGPENIKQYADNSNYSTTVKISPYYGKLSKYAPNVQKIECPQQRVVRQDPLTEKTDTIDYHQQASVLTGEVYHTATDVMAYAKGPLAHLLHSTQDQTHLFYVITFAANVGPIKRDEAYGLVYGHSNAGGRLESQLVVTMVLISIVTFWKF